MPFTIISVIDIRLMSVIVCGKKMNVLATCRHCAISAMALKVTGHRDGFDSRPRVGSRHLLVCIHILFDN